MATDLNTVTVGGVTYSKADYEAMQATKSTGSVNDSLDKDAFLQLLVTQMQYQDPLDPQDNSEYVAQLAQFSALEQMTNMSTSFAKMASFISSQEAANTLGKTVELNVGDTTTRGIVEGATRGDNPQILVNGMYYTLDKIAAVYAN